MVAHRACQIDHTSWPKVELDFVDQILKHYSPKFSPCRLTVAKGFTQEFELELTQRKKNYDPYLFVCLIRYFSLVFIRLGASVFMLPFTKNHFYGLTEFQFSICECSEQQLGD